MRGPEEKQRRKDIEGKRRERSELLAWASSCTGVRLEEVSQVRCEAQLTSTVHLGACAACNAAFSCGGQHLRRQSGADYMPDCELITRYGPGRVVRVVKCKH